MTSYRRPHMCDYALCARCGIRARTIDMIELLDGDEVKRFDGSCWSAEMFERPWLYESWLEQASWRNS